MIEIGSNLANLLGGVIVAFVILGFVYIVKKY